VYINSNWTLDNEQELIDKLDPYDYDQMVQAAAANIYSRGHDTLTFLAELHKVRDMVRGFLPRLISCLTRGRIDQIWLEGRYGWRTLIYDIQDIHDALQNFDEKRKRYSERVGRTYRSTDVVQYQTNWTSSTHYFTQTTNWEIGVRGAVTADISPPRWSFNPITTAWELLTLSFVVDWIINVGQALEAMSFIALSSDYEAAGGYFVKAERTLVLDNTDWNDTFSGTAGQSSFCTRTFTLRRPTSVPSTPSISVNLDLFKIADLVAIIRGLMR
jgi:hypothetical protein